MKKLSLMIFSLVPLLLWTCTKSTYVTGTWTSPDIPEMENYDNIFVAALTDNTQIQSIIENDIADELEDRGIEVITSVSHTRLDLSSDDNGEDQVMKEIRNTGADAIMTVSLIDKDTDVRYVPGTYAYDPYPAYGYYGTFWGYYSYWQPRVYSDPGYYAREKTYFFETNVYDAESGKLIWSAQSETYNPSDLESFSEGFASVITDELKEDAVLM